MTLQVEVTLGIFAAQVLFFAGGGWFLVKLLRREVSQLRKEVNGVGCKVRYHQAIDIAGEEDPGRRLELANVFFGGKT